MADSDTEVPFSQIDLRVYLEDGAGNSIELELVQNDPEITVEGKPWSEARSRNQHASGTPIGRETGDGNITGSMTMLLKSFLGDTEVTPKEALTRTGNAAAWTSTMRGMYAIQIRIVADASASGGATQTTTYRYCVCRNVKWNFGGANGLATLSFDFTDLENEPQIT